MTEGAKEVLPLVLFEQDFIWYLYFGEEVVDEHQVLPYVVVEGVCLRLIKVVRRAGCLLSPNYSGTGFFVDLWARFLCWDTRKFSCAGAVLLLLFLLLLMSLFWPGGWTSVIWKRLLTFCIYGRWRSIAPIGWGFFRAWSKRTLVVDVSWRWVGVYWCSRVFFSWPGSCLQISICRLYCHSSVFSCKFILFLLRLNLPTRSR